MYKQRWIKGYLGDRALIDKKVNINSSFFYWFHSLCSFTSWRRTEATREHVSAFHGGLCTTSTTAPRQICGCTERTAGTFITTGSKRWRSAASLRETSSPVSSTWRPEPSRSARMERWETELKITNCSKLYFSLQMNRLRLYRFLCLHTNSSSIFFKEKTRIPIRHGMLSLNNQMTEKSLSLSQ